MEEQEAKIVQLTNHPLYPWYLEKQNEMYSISDEVKMELNRFVSHMVQEIGLGVIECFNLLEALNKLEPAGRAKEISEAIRQLFTNPEERNMASNKLARKLNAWAVNVYSTTPYLKRSLEMMKLMQSGKYSSTRTRRKRSAAPVSAIKAKLVKVENQTTPVMATQLVTGAVVVKPSTNGPVSHAVTNANVSVPNRTNHSVPAAVKAGIPAGQPAQSVTNNSAPSKVQAHVMGQHVMPNSTPGQSLAQNVTNHSVPSRPVMSNATPGQPVAQNASNHSGPSAVQARVTGQLAVQSQSNAAPGQPVAQNVTNHSAAIQARVVGQPAVYNQSNATPGKPVAQNVANHSASPMVQAHIARQPVVQSQSNATPVTQNVANHSAPSAAQAQVPGQPVVQSQLSAIPGQPPVKNVANNSPSLPVQAHVTGQPVVQNQ
mmetsp:Transcript_17778/g.33692  ORF Transcript_17778/g.33692 Transcript_17778/m.33692 type:complete len:430 (-) Transcript_17778:288-1577(-)